MLDRPPKQAVQAGRLDKALADAKRKLAMGGAGGAKPEDIGGIQLIASHSDDLPPKELRPLAESLMQQMKSGVVIATSALDGKASIVIAVSEDRTEQLDAVALVRAAAEAVGGKGGGGRPTMAQAGGPDGAKIPQAADTIRTMVKNLATSAA